MPTTTAEVSLEEYLNTSYDPDCDYIDGVLIGRNVGTQLHGLLQTLVASYLLRLSKEHRLSVFTETRLSIGGGRHRIPDVMAVEKPYARGKVVVNIPIIVVEIKSPDDTLDDILERCLDYAALGVANIVVLDPDKRRQFVFADEKSLRLVSSITLRLSDGSTLPFPVDEMFNELHSEGD